MVWLALISWQCRKAEAPKEPITKNKVIYGKVIDRTDNTIVPNCVVGIYNVTFDGAFDRFTRLQEVHTGADGSYEFHVTQQPNTRSFYLSVDEGPDGYSYDGYLPGMDGNSYLGSNIYETQNKINKNIITNSFGLLKVRFIGDGTGNEVVLGYGGGTDYIFRHGCDTIAWWSNESGKPANFRYWVYGMNDTTSHLINDIMIKFGTVYKEVHF